MWKYWSKFKVREDHKQRYLFDPILKTRSSRQTDKHLDVCPVGIWENHVNL